MTVGFAALSSKLTEVIVLACDISEVAEQSTAISAGRKIKRIIGQLSSIETEIEYSL